MPSMVLILLTVQHLDKCKKSNRLYILLIKIKEEKIGKYT